MKSIVSLEELFITVALLLPAGISEALWIVVWKHMPSVISPRGVSTFRFVFLGISLYTVLYCIGVIVFTYIINGIERKLVPPVTVYLAGITHILLMVAIAIIYPYFV